MTRRNAKTNPKSNPAAARRGVTITKAAKMTLGPRVAGDLQAENLRLKEFVGTLFFNLWDEGRIPADLLQRIHVTTTPQAGVQTPEPYKVAQHTANGTAEFTQ